MDEREGHVFVNNVLAADEQFNRPLLRFDQMRMLCGKLTRPQVTQLDGNVYIRAGDTSRNLFVWSPVEGSNCVANVKTLADLQKLAPEFETHSQSMNLPLGAVFRSPDLARYELIRALGDSAALGALPADIQQLLAWPDKEPRVPGAYPLRP